MDNAPPLTESRTGRDQQRWGEEGQRLVCGCIPFRITAAQEIEVALISNRDKQAWIFPKVRRVYCLDI